MPGCGCACVCVLRPDLGRAGGKAAAGGGLLCCVFGHGVCVCVPFCVMGDGGWVIEMQMEMERYRDKSVHVFPCLPWSMAAMVEWTETLFGRVHVG